MLFEMEHENKTELLGECSIVVTKIISVVVEQTTTTKRNDTIFEGSIRNYSWKKIENYLSENEK